MGRFALPIVILGCIALAAFLTWLVMSSVSFDGRPSRAEAHAERQEMSAPQAVPPFRRLDVSGTAEVVLVQGAAESVALSAASRKAGFLRAEVRDDTLYVESGDSSRWWDFVLGSDGAHAARVVVTYKDLEAIAAAGTVKLVASGMKVDALRVAGAGGTVIRLDDLAAREFKLSGAGALRADVSGVVTDQTVTISGAGDYRGGKLVSQNATVSVAGAGKVLINAQKTLTATISGAGSVEYLGEPRVTERVSGAGRVRRRDAAGPFGPVASERGGRGEAEGGATRRSERAEGQARSARPRAMAVADTPA